MIAPAIGMILGFLAIVAAIAPRRFWTWFVSRRVVCSWCKRIIRIGGPLSFLPRRRVSHGCCARCAVKFGAAWLADRGARALAIAAAFFFLCAIGFSACNRNAAPKAVPASAIEQSDELKPEWQLVALCEVEA